MTVGQNELKRATKVVWCITKMWRAEQGKEKGKGTRETRQNNFPHSWPAVVPLFLVFSTPPLHAFHCWHCCRMWSAKITTDKVWAKLMQMPQTIANSNNNNNDNNIYTLYSIYDSTDALCLGPMHSHWVDIDCIPFSCKYLMGAQLKIFRDLWLKNVDL